MTSLAALLRKEFSAPSSPTTGLAAYNLEGQTKRTHPETRAALLKPKKMLTSLIPLIEKGDKPGHPFRGNQYQTRTARDSELTRLRLAELLVSQRDQVVGNSVDGWKVSDPRVIDAYQMMESALGDVGTTVHYTTDGDQIVAAVGYQRRGADLHVGFLGSIRRGEGARLLSRVEATADREGLPVTLMALSGSKPFYEARGYTVTNPKTLEMARMPKAKVKKLDYTHPETCHCCAQNGATAVLKGAPKSRVREYVENRSNALKSAISGLLKQWGKKWAKELAQALPAEKRDKPDHPFRGNQHTGGLSSEDQELHEKAQALAEMDPETRDNLDVADYGWHAYLLYEARAMMPKKEGSFKMVNDENSFALWQEADAVVNVGGRPHLAIKDDDPDDENDEGLYVWSFHDPSRSEERFGGGYTSPYHDKKDALADYKEHLKGAGTKKIDLSLLTKASTKTLDEILQDLDVDGFSIALMDMVSPAMRKAFKDGGLAARKMVGLENDAREMLELMDEDALDFARHRAAELVGKQIVDGKLRENPNPKWSINETTRNGLRNLVSEAITLGWGPGELQQRILDSFFFSDQRAEMIARTELAHAHVQGNLEGWRSTGVVAGKRSILADTHPFEDVCDENELQGAVPLDEPFQDGSMGPPYHPNCVLPDTKLSAFGVLKAYKRWFVGEVVSLLCEGDHNLTVTPNHPVLTQRGWLPAGQVKAGDFLFKSDRPDLIVPLISPDHYYMPTPAHELFDSLGLSGSVRPVIKLSGTSAFHGDGISDSEVHVVDANGLLRGDWKSQLKKHLEQLLFPLSQLSGLLIGLGSKFFGLDRVLVTNAGQEGMRSYSATFSKVTPGVKKGLSLNSSPQGKPAPLEVFVNGGRVTVEALSKIYGAFSGKVAPVQVLDVSVSEYRGHVFNLSTKDGWYFADGIITHNCLCDIVPVLDDEMPGYKKTDLGLLVKGQ